MDSRKSFFFSVENCRDEGKLQSSFLGCKWSWEYDNRLDRLEEGVRVGDAVSRESGLAAGMAAKLLDGKRPRVSSNWFMVLNYVLVVQIVVHLKHDYFFFW